MSDALTDLEIKGSFGRVLQVANGNDGIDGELRPLRDGKGDASALSISTFAARVNGDLTVAGTTVLAGNASAVTPSLGTNTTAVQTAAGTLAEITAGATRMTVASFDPDGLTRPVVARFQDSAYPLNDRVVSGGDGTTVVTAQIQAAINYCAANGLVLSVPRRHYVTDRLEIPSNLVLRADQGAIFRLPDGSDNSLLASVSAGVERVDISGLRLIGNKATIAEGDISRAIDFRFLGAGYITLTDLVAEDFEDHGILVSRLNAATSLEAIGANVATRVQALRCGKGPGSVGGTGILFAGTLFGCVADGCYRNGFKSSTADYYGCSALNTVGGGGFEGGFGSNQRVSQNYVGCRVYNVLGSGWRFQGEADYLTITDCEAHLCGASGIDVFGNTVSMKIKGFRAINCGNSADPRGVSVGRDGISFLKANTGRPQGVHLSDITCVDLRDSGSKTQQYGLYVEGNDYEIEIGPGCEFTGNRDGAMRLSGGLNNPGQATNGAMTVVRSPIKGTNNWAAITARIDHTGTTDSTPLWAVTIPGAEPHVGSMWRLRITGTTTGTAGTKQVRVESQGTSTLVVNQSSGTTGFFSAEAEFVFTAATAVRVALVTATNTRTGTTNSFSSGTDLTFGVQAQLGSAADTITLYSLTWEQIR